MYVDVEVSILEINIPFEYSLLFIECVLHICFIYLHVNRIEIEELIRFNEMLDFCVLKGVS